MNRTTFRNLRRVWAYLTKRPHASIREIAAVLRIAYTTVARHIRTLVAAGYVEQGGNRARRVLVPLVEVGR
jgi:DNA-binding MarR family transcriptional regulator